MHTILAMHQIAAGGSEAKGVKELHDYLAQVQPEHVKKFAEDLKQARIKKMIEDAQEAKGVLRRQLVREAHRGYSSQKDHKVPIKGI